MCSLEAFTLVNRVKYITVMGSLVLFFYIPAQARIIENGDPSTFLVVIDAGHGGRDDGTVHHQIKEKDIVLDLATALGQAIKAFIPEAEIVYTRQEDVFIPLDKRISLANDLKADLFVSLHCNAAEDNRATGTETFVMGLHSSEENLEVAKRENASILFESNYAQTYADFDPFSIEGHILLSAIQNDHLGQSIEVAENIQQQVRLKTGLMDRGVRQAGFVLLRKATMPAILVETAFLSNGRDAAFLSDPRSQEKLARSIASGIADYGREVLNRKQKTSPLSSNDEILKTEQLDLHTTIPTPIPEIWITNPLVKEIIVQPLMDENISTIPDQQELEREPVLSATSLSSDLEIVYKIQIASTKKHVEKVPFDNLETVGEVEIRQEDDLYKFVVGGYLSLEEAITEQGRIRAEGFKGAFVVAYQNGKRVNLSKIGS